MANRAKTSEWIFEDVFCAGVWVASAPLHGTRKITKSGNMLKAEIGREQLSFASNNLSANFNAYYRISIFLRSIPKSPQPPTHPHRKAVEKALRCFRLLRRPRRAFPAYAGFHKRMSRERNWRKRAVPEGEIKLHPLRSRYSSKELQLRSPSSFFEILQLSAGEALSGWMHAENSTYFEHLSWGEAGRSRRLGMICWKVLKEGRAALIDQRMPEA